MYLEQAIRNSPGTSRRCFEVAKPYNPDRLKRALSLFLAAGMFSLSPAVFAGQQIAERKAVLTLEQAEKIALSEEPGISSQQWQAKALVERSVADGQLQDPKLHIGVANMPTDTFEFNQENMTQFKVGIVQQFPAGNTLGIRQQKTSKQSELFKSKLADRKLTVTKEVRLTYFEAYYWEQAKKTINENRKLFARLADNVQSLFSSGKNSQRDLVRAQLELSRMDDRLAKAIQKTSVERVKLSRWVGTANSYKPLAAEFRGLHMRELAEDFQVLSQLLLNHPRVQQVDRQLEVSRKEIELARESYKPGWALSVSYGYRDDAPDGRDRSDFLSAGVSMDLPVFTANRQDKKLLSREHEHLALKDKRTELIRQLVTDLQQQIVIEKQLANRHQLYKDLLLPQAKQQTQASLLAYQSDKGGFTEVMRAHIDQLNASLDEQRILTDLRQARARILYFISGSIQQTEYGT